jgi:hypothetical protein
MNALKNLALIGIGAAVGYFAALWKLEKMYAEQPEENITASKEIVEETDEDNSKQDWVSKPSPEFALSEQATKAIRNYQRGTVADVPESENVNTSEELDENPNDPTLPYIISHDEFATDNEFDKHTVRYFEEDKVVCDDSDLKLPEAMVRSHIGYDNLEKFGSEYYRYIRSEKHQAEYEVCLVHGRYSVEVEGHHGPEVMM